MLVNLSTNKLYFIERYFPLTLASIEVLVKIVEVQVYLKLPNLISNVSKFKQAILNLSSTPFIDIFNGYSLGFHIYQLSVGKTFKFLKTISEVNAFR